MKKSYFRWNSEEGHQIVKEVLAQGKTARALEEAAAKIHEKYKIDMKPRSVAYAVKTYGNGNEVPAVEDVEKIREMFTYLFGEFIRLRTLEAENAGLRIENESLKAELRSTKTMFERKFSYHALEKAGAVAGD